MGRTLHATVALLVVVAGCGALPGDGAPDAPQRTVSVDISNEHSERYRVTVSALPPEIEGLEVTYENGSTRRFAVSSFDALPRDGLRNATAVTTTDSRALTREFTVRPTEGIGATLDDAPANATVVYFVRQEPGRQVVRGAGVVRCGAGTETTHLAVRIRSDGSLHSSVTCSGPVE